MLHVSPYNDAGILPTYTLGISSANTTGLTAADLPGIRSGDLTTANNLYANLAGIMSSAAPDLQRHQHHFRLCPGRHQSAST